jgi:hypothetical protein
MTEETKMARFDDPSYNVVVFDEIFSPVLGSWLGSNDTATSTPRRSYWLPATRASWRPSTS